MLERFVDLATYMRASKFVGDESLVNAMERTDAMAEEYGVYIQPWFIIFFEEWCSVWRIIRQ